MYVTLKVISNFDNDEKLLLAEIFDAMAEGNKIADNIRSDPSNLVMEKKDDLSVVGIADKKIQEYYTKRLAGELGGLVVGEESEGVSGKQNELGYKWIFDPIDGTTNWAAGAVKGGYAALSFSCSSVAVHKNNESYAGVVRNFDTGDFFFAIKGKGAFVFSQKYQQFIELTANKEMAFDETSQKPILGFGHVDTSIRAAIDKEFRTITKEKGIGGSTREIGATALELCLVAASSSSVYTAKANLWDYAAGILIAEEAGAKTRLVKGEPDKDGKAYDTFIAMHPDLEERIGKAFDREVALKKVAPHSTSHALDLSGATR